MPLRIKIPPPLFPTLTPKIKEDIILLYYLSIFFMKHLLDAHMGGHRQEGGTPWGGGGGGREGGRGSQSPSP